MQATKRTRAIHAALILVVVVPLFVANGRWGTEANGDSVAVALPAWELSRGGTLDLSSYEYIDTLPKNQVWYATLADGRVVSNRAPGLIALSFPAYWAIEPSTFTNAPATLVAMMLTLTAVFVFWIAMSRYVPIRFATGATVVVALGTTTWAISSAEMWPHGPGQLWAALVVAFVGTNSYALSGVAFAFSITTRPLTAVFAAITGTAETIRRRHWKPAVLIGSISALGAFALLAYNRLLFGYWTLLGGYSEVSDSLSRFDLGEYVLNVWTMFFGIRNGVLVTSPVIGLAAFAALRYRHRIEPWMRSLAFAGIGYLLVHALLNGASGGLTIFYRYPLEALILAGPALVVGAYHLSQSGRKGSFAVVAMASASVSLQVLNVFILSCYTTSPVVPACLLS